MEPHRRDRPWFVERVRDHQARLRASIRALGVRAESVDDFAQDALVLAWQKLDEFDGGDFGAWVGQIARRLVANERRKDARRNRILAGEVTDLMLRCDAPAGPLEALEREEALTALRGCLAGLPPRGREMIQWRYFDHLSPGSIAGHLGRPSNYVRQSLLRLRRLLLECLDRKCVNGGAA